MVETQLRRRGISDPRVLAAFQDVPRELFVPLARQDQAFDDNPLPIGHEQTISQPFIVAYMVEYLDVRADHRVLDIGAGSGYQTAILARLADHVYAIERLPELTARAAAALADLNVTNVTLTTGDGSVGLPAHAPYDRIIAGAAGPDIPAEWIDQLADGGRIVAPIGPAGVQTVVLLKKRGNHIVRESLCAVRFVKLLGESAWPD